MRHKGQRGGAEHSLLPCAQHLPCPPPDALDYSLRSQSDLDDQHDYDSVASDEDTDQELLRNASRNNRARVSPGPGLDPHPDPSSGIP